MLYRIYNLNKKFLYDIPFFNTLWMVALAKSTSKYFALFMLGNYNTKSLK